jgi:hypothetical protein
MKTKEIFEKTFVTQAHMIHAFARYYNIVVRIDKILASTIVNPPTIDAIDIYQELHHQFNRTSHTNSFLWRTPIGRNIANLICFLKHGNQDERLKNMLLGRMIHLDGESFCDISVHLVEPILVEKSFQFYE